MTIDQLLASPYFSVAIAVLTSAIVALLRWKLPERWATLPRRAQVLPALVVAAVLSSLTAGVRAGVDALQGLGVEFLPLLAQGAVDWVLGWLGAIGTQQAAKRVRPAGAPPSDGGTVTRIQIPSTRDGAGTFGGAAILMLVLLCSGCAGSFEEARKPSLKLGAAPPSARCVQLDDRAAFYGGVAKGSAVLAGAAAPVAVLTDDQAIQIGAAIGGGVLGAVAAGTGLVSDASARSWARECAR